MQRMQEPSRISIISINRNLMNSHPRQRIILIRRIRILKLWKEDIQMKHLGDRYQDLGRVNTVGMVQVKPVGDKTLHTKAWQCHRLRHQAHILTQQIYPKSRVHTQLITCSSNVNLEPSVLDPQAQTGITFLT